MILGILLLWLAVGAVLAGAAGWRNPAWPRWIALFFTLVFFGAIIGLWAAYGPWRAAPAAGAWLVELRLPWIPALGAGFHLGLDGLSLLLLLLTGFLGVIAVAASWKGIQTRTGFFHFHILLILAALTGTFLTLDLLLFYFFWELILIPLYFLIGIWGHENRRYAAIKFFLFTQIGSLLMLLAILGLYFLHGTATGAYTFDYQALLGTPLAPASAFLLMLGFLAAFAVKLPAVPLHTWLADAHTEAPTAGSVILAGVVLKAGAYGFLRFLIPLFPDAAATAAPAMMVLGVAGILYGALLAFGQRDVKRMVAYTSVSHMGFVLLGLFAWNGPALQGALVVILAHGVGTGALFLLAGGLQDRLRTRDMAKMGGFWSGAPKMGAAALFFALAALGLPGLASFVGEILVLVGVYSVSVPLAVAAAIGFIASMAYALIFFQRIFTGKEQPILPAADLDRRESVLFVVMALGLLAIGLYPQPVLDTFQPAMENLTGGSYQSAPAAGMDAVSPEVAGYGAEADE